MMNKLLISFGVFLFSFTGTAQNMRPSEIAFFGGRSFYNFHFRADNPNEGIKYNYRDGFNYGLNYYLTWNERLSLRGELLAYQAGSQATYGGNRAEWRLNYAGLGIGYLFAFLQEGQTLKVRMEGGLQVGVDYLLNAYQLVNNIRYDLKDESAFKSINLRAGPVLRMRYSPTPKLFLGLEYRFDYGLIQIEKEDASLGQKTNNYGHTAQAFVGLKIF